MNRYPLSKRELSLYDIELLDVLFKERDSIGIQNGTPEYAIIQAQIDALLEG